LLFKKKLVISQIAPKRDWIYYYSDSAALQEEFLESLSPQT